MDVGQEINIGPRKFGKRNKRRAWKIWQKFEVFVMKKNDFFLAKFNKCRAFK